MTICLVTDRRRLVRGGADGVDARQCLLEQVRCAVGAGVDLIQVRERDLEAGALAALVTDLLAITRRTPTRIVVNDRLDVALAAGADGVHLRADSMSVADARRLAPAGFLVGRSVHGAGEAAAAADADYLIAGTVFPSRSKDPSHRLLGLDGLRAIVSASVAPVLAIGGVTAEHLDAIAAAGAAGIAAIGLFTRAADAVEHGGCGAFDLRAVVADARSRFDRVNTAF
ncbi:MAG TPA: thiamine phosphate synthase [Vicinamibacterales bacterium]|nr:thiamine phosphate synthase [Vicinamibacterales bacterium]